MELEGPTQHHCSSTQTLQGPPCSTLYTMSAKPHVPIVPCSLSLGPPCPWGGSHGEGPLSAGAGGSPALTTSWGASSDGEHCPMGSILPIFSQGHPLRVGVLLQQRHKIEAVIPGLVAPDPK